MRSMKKLSVLVAVFALCAIGAANASAAEFTASVVGTDIERVSNEPQVFTTSSGAVTCNTVGVTGKTAAAAAPSQHVTIHYTGCTGPFGIPAHVSPATYEFTAQETQTHAESTAGPLENVHVRNTITITITAPIFLGGTCTVKVAPQTVGRVEYTTQGSHILLDPNVTGIDYVGSGGVCSSGNNGTYEGNTTIKAKSGTLAHHH